MRLRGLIVSTAVIFLALGAQANAAKRFAAPDGTGPAATCPKSDPCSLIDAVNDFSSVQNGDEVIMKAGHYDIGSDELDPPAKINLHGKRGAAPVIEAASSPFATALSLSHDSRIADLVIDNTTGQAFTAFFSSDGAKVERVLAIGASDVFATCAPPRRPGWMRDTVCVNTGGGAAVGIFESGGGETHFDLANVTALSTASAPSAQDNGLRFHVEDNESIHVHATNVIALGSTNADVYAEAETPTAAVTITAKHCDFASREEVGTDAHVSAPGSGSNIKAAPKLRDIGNQDFREKANSPTVNKGANKVAHVGTGKFDVEGKKRRHGKHVDIGAAEL